MSNLIDIYSKGDYPANILSNFSPNNFIMDGVECACMEGFLQSLKYRSIKKQIKICGLVGKEAKKAGKKKFFWRFSGNLYWQGKRYKRISKEFDELLLRAYKEMLKNEAFYNALKSSKNCLLKHSIGKHDKRKTILTEEEFINYLYLLRNEMIV